MLDELARKLLGALQAAGREGIDGLFTDAGCNDRAASQLLPIELKSEFKHELMCAPLRVNE
jgi:hypothetical protein